MRTPPTSAILAFHTSVGRDRPMDPMTRRPVLLTTPHRYETMHRLAATLDRAALLQGVCMPLMGAMGGWFGPRSVQQPPSAAPPRGIGVMPGRELAYAVARRGGWPHHDLVPRRAAAFDRAVARRLASLAPEVIVALPSASRASFTAARAAGTRAVLYQNGNAWTAEEACRSLAGAAAHSAERAEIRRLFAIEGSVAEADEEVELAHLVIAQSDLVRDVLVGRGVDPGKLVVLPNGVDSRRFRPTPRDEASRPLRVLCASTVSYRKGLPFLVEGARRAKRSVEQVTVVGPRPFRAPHLEARLAGVRLVGEVPVAAMPSWYAWADVFALATLAESSARAILEAMASGLPVVITPQAGCSEIVRDGVEGLVVPAGDAAAIAETFRRLSEDGWLRTRLGAAARRRAEEYSWERNQAGFLNLLTAVRAAKPVRAGVTRAKT